MNKRITSFLEDPSCKGRVALRWASDSPTGELSDLSCLPHPPTAGLLFASLRYVHTYPPSLVHSSLVRRCQQFSSIASTHSAQQDSQATLSHRWHPSRPPTPRTF